MLSHLINVLLCATLEDLVASKPSHGVPQPSQGAPQPRSEVTISNSAKIPQKSMFVHQLMHIIIVFNYHCT